MLYLKFQRQYHRHDIFLLSFSSGINRDQRQIQTSSHQPAEIRGILFDKDGTLVDFDLTWIPAYFKALDVFCLDQPDDDLRQRCLTAAGYDLTNNCTIPNSPLAVEGADDIAAIWLQVAGQPNHADRIAGLVAIMEQAAADSPAPLFDVAALFADLAARDLVLGIATMDAEWVARRTLEHLQAAEHVTYYAGYDSGFGRKPGPGMVSRFCDDSGLRPEQVMVVGDNLHDLHMARAAGAGLAVGVCSGVATAPDLASDADHVIADAREVTGLPGLSGFSGL